MNDGIKKVKRFFASRTWQVLVGLGCAFAGFFIESAIQNDVNSDITAIIRELPSSETTLDDASQLQEKVIRILDIMRSHISAQSFIFALLSFFFGFTITNALFSTEKKNETSTDKKSETLTTDENVLVNFLEHLIEDCYNRCSNTDCIDGCPKLASECNGLLKRYLYEESKLLKSSILLSRTGKYDLDNNIEQFHTIAIDHLIAAKSKRYAVVQWVGSKPYTEDNKYQETYDMMDFHFLNVLLEKLTATKKKTKQQKSKNKSAQYTSFKIKWLLIGDIKCMKNNFDYIFYVIKLKSLETDVSKFFEFYLIAESDYKTAVEPILARSGDFCKRLLNIDNEPSFGIFGDFFMFADSTDSDHHGSIYTRKYNPENDQHNDVIATLNQSFDELINNGKTEQPLFDSLMKEYNKILRADSAWEKHLETIWHPKNH